MKTKNLFIKGLLLSTLAIFTFVLNVHPIVSTYMATNQTTEIQSEYSDIQVVTPKYTLIPTTYAEDKTNLQDTLNKIAQKARLLHVIFFPFVNFFAFHIGGFLGNDYIFGGSMGTMLHSIWLTMRNLVNIIFVLILLFIALKEIFDLSNSESKLKEQILKFALLLIAVNFSWLGTKIVLDAANVMSNVVFSIPMNISNVTKSTIVGTQEGCDVKWAQRGSTTELEPIGMCIPTKIYMPITNENLSYMHLNANDADGKGECADAGTNYHKYFEELKTAKTGDNITSGNVSVTTAAENIFVWNATTKAWEKKKKLTQEELTAAGPGAIQPPLKTSVPEDSKQVKSTVTFCWAKYDLSTFNQNTATVYMTYGMAKIQKLIKSNNDNVAELSIGILMSLIMNAAYVVALFAFFVALILRMAVLWLFVAFSPIMILLLWQGIDKVAGSLPIKLENFVQWAFMPVQIGAVFSVAFLMVSAGQAASLDTFNSNLADIEVAGKTMSIEIAGVDTLFGGMDNLTEFIWYIITLVILWMGVFTILKKSEFDLLKINGWIDSKGQKLGELAATMPYWAPIMPMVDPSGKIKWTSAEASPIGGVLRFEEAANKWRREIRGNDNNPTSKAKDKIKEMGTEKVAALKAKYNGKFTDADMKELFRKLNISADDANKDRAGMKELFKAHFGMSEAQFDDRLDSILKLADKTPDAVAPAATAVVTVDVANANIVNATTTQLVSPSKTDHIAAADAIVAETASIGTRGDIQTNFKTIADQLLLTGPPRTNLWEAVGGSGNAPA